jgi:alpha-1,3-rhamnosyl/mannosyltransferase
MTVAVDTTGIYVTQAGIARYVHGLIRGLKRVAPPQLNWYPLAWEVENFGYKQPWRAMRTAYREMIWGKLVAPRRMTREKTDLFHATSSLFMRVPRDVKHVITLHDLSISRHPERFRPHQVRAWQNRLPVLRHADRIITISKFTADEAIRLLGLPADRIRVVHNGCDFHPDEAAPREAPPTEVELPKEFFFFLGSLEPGKNLKLLRDAYLSAEADGINLPPLVIVGARWEGVSAEGSHPKNWIYLGRQPDEVVVYAYRRALALVFPAIYEGFGLPVIEAMSLDCPVICSPVSALPEVAGDAAMMVEQTPAAYRAAMLRLTNENVTREDLIHRGRARSGEFSWSRCATQVVDVYHEVLKR